MPDEEPRSNLFSYILLWLLGLGIFSVLQVLAATSKFEMIWEKWWILRASYFVYCLILMVTTNYFEGKRLMEYLKLNHHSTWKEITYVRGFGSGNINHSRAQDFIWYEENLGDAYLEKLKRNFRRFRVYIWCVFASTGASFIFGVFVQNYF